jgi:hypothetical protein
MVEGHGVGRKELPTSPRATKARAKLLLHIATPAFVNFVSFCWEISQKVRKETKGAMIELGWLERSCGSGGLGRVDGK